MIKDPNVRAKTVKLLEENKIPGQVAQLVGASSHMPKGCGFDLWSEHMPR